MILDRRATRTWTLAIALIVASATACVEVPEGPQPRAAASLAPGPIVPRGPGPMRPPVATKLGPELAAIGLDVRNLPPIETLDPDTKRQLMTTFSESLGVPCIGCHAEGDLSADTRRKRVAKRMYNEIVRVLALESGEPVFCDSCHQGTMFFLDRRDKSKVADFMSDALVGKMKRVDGKDHECETCHGDPPDFDFLSAWKASPAPDLAPATAKPATTAAAEPKKPSKPPSKPAAPKPEPTPKKTARRAPACGGKANPCPLQEWMRRNVSPAVARNDTAALAVALDKIATLSPDPSWTWAEISKTAAEAARRGDMAGARKSCQACHDAYKEAWREKYRTRRVP